MFNWDEYQAGVAAKENPQLLKQHLANIEAERTGIAAREGYGQAAAPRETSPFEAELFPGEEPISGLMDVTREAEPGWGLIGSAESPTEQRYLEMQKANTYGGTGGMAQQGRDLSNMQNSMMQNLGAGQRDTARNINAAQMNDARNLTSRQNNQNTVAGQMRRQQQGQRFDLANAPDPNTMSTKERISAGNALRGDFDDITKDFRTMDRSYKNIVTAEDSGMGDVSMIFNIMKIFDPASSVRESEVATASNASGVPTWLMNMNNQVLKGRELSPTARKELTAQAENMYRNSAKGYDAKVGQYTDMSNRYGLDPRNIVTPRSAVVKPGKGSPQAVGHDTNQLSQQAQQVAQQMQEGGASVSEVNQYVRDQLLSTKYKGWKVLP